MIEIDNPSKPDLSQVEEIHDPIIRATIIMPQEYVGRSHAVRAEARRAGEHAARAAR